MRPALRIAVAIAAAVAFVAALGIRQSLALRARLVSADPDAIEHDAALAAYARVRGRAVYDADCAQCHGEDLHGDPGRGAPDLVDGDWLYGTGRAGQIERIVSFGIRAGNSRTQNAAGMPAYARAVPYARYAIDPLTPRELHDVAALVYSFQHGSGADADAVRRGRIVYQGKGLCFDCHGDHAAGNSAIGAPNLTDATWLYGDGSLPSIEASVARGLAGVCPSWWSRLSPSDIRATALYVHERAAPGPADAPRRIARR